MFARRAILMAYFWPSAVFWPFLINVDGSFRPFAVDFVYLENGKDVFEHGANKMSLFRSNNFNSPVLFSVVRWSIFCRWAVVKLLHMFIELF